MSVWGGGTVWGGGGGGSSAGVVQSKTANFNVATGDYDNDGATGTITGTVLATCRRFSVSRVDAYEVRLAPPSGASIIWSGGTMTADEYLRLTDNASSVSGYVNTAGNVVITAETGGLEEQTP